MSYLIELFEIESCFTGHIWGAFKQKPLLQLSEMKGWVFHFIHIPGTLSHTCHIAVYRSREANGNSLIKSQALEIAAF